MNSLRVTRNGRLPASQSHAIRSPAIGSVGKGAGPIECACIPSAAMTSLAASVKTQSIVYPGAFELILSAPFVGNGGVEIPLSGGRGQAPIGSI